MTNLNWKKCSQRKYGMGSGHRCTRGGGGHFMYPLSMRIKKFGHKNAIKNKNRRPPQIFSQPQVPPQKNFKTIVHLCMGENVNEEFCGWANDPKTERTFWIIFFYRKNIFYGKNNFVGNKSHFQVQPPKNEESTYTEWVSLNVITENVLSHLVDDYT